MNEQLKESPLVWKQTPNGYKCQTLPFISVGKSYMDNGFYYTLGEDMTSCSYPSAEIAMQEAWRYYDLIAAHKGWPKL